MRKEDETQYFWSFFISKRPLWNCLCELPSEQRLVSGRLETIRCIVSTERVAIESVCIQWECLREFEPGESLKKLKNLWILNLNEQPFSVIIDVETLRDVDGGTRRPFGAMSKSDVYMVKFEEIKMFSFAWIILKNCSIFCSKNSIRFFTSQTLFWQCHSLPASAYYTGEWEWLQRVAGKCLQTLW